MLSNILCGYLFFGLNILATVKGQNQVRTDLEPPGFSNIVLSPIFVDKTLLIKELLTNNRTSVITVPPKFGKTTNLDMIQQFLEIEVDENGVKRTKANYLIEPVTDTENYKLFSENKFKIVQEVLIMNNFFGRTPVLRISFRCSLPIHELSDVLKYFQQVVHQTFRKYIYLLNSEALELQHKQLVEKWCDEQDFGNFDEPEVITALRTLSEYLYRHFHQRKVFVLIDDHDYAVSSVVSRPTDDSIMESLIVFSGNMMNSLLKKNRMFVQGGLMTGVVDLPAVGSPPHNTKDPESFQVYRFLDDHKFVDYYGLTKDEVEELVVAHNIKETIENIAAKYNGYLRKRGERIYNIFSVLNFIKSGKLENYWTICNKKEYFENIMQIEYIKNNISEVVRNESVHVDAIDKVTVKDFQHFNNVITNPNFKLSDVSRVFFFFFAEGYFTYKTGIIIQIDKDAPKIGLRCPNDEIKGYFQSVLRHQQADC